MHIQESNREICIRVPKPTAHYFDEFLKTNSSVDMLAMELFPNAKEVTESFGAYDAVRRHLLQRFRLDDPSIILVAVGDGSTPRTAATFAYRTRWQCHSVDPSLGDKSRWIGINRLTLHRNKIEECNRQSFGITDDSLVLVVAVHSHARLEDAVKVCSPFKRMGVVAIPCCVPQTLNYELNTTYEDWGIWSPHRQIKVWDLPW